MGRARNLANLKPNAQGLIEADDIAAGVIPEGSTSLAGSYAIASTKSVTANRVVSLNADGTVQNFEGIPSAPTVVTNFSSVSNIGSNDGSLTRAFTTTQGSGSNPTVTVVGQLITDSGLTTGGSVSVGTTPNSFYGGSPGAIATDSQLPGVFYTQRNGISSEFGTSYGGWATLTVDASGNPSYSTPSNVISSFGGSFPSLTQIADNVFYTDSWDRFIVFPTSAGAASWSSASGYSNLGASGQTFFINNRTKFLRLRTDGSTTVCDWNGSNTISNPLNSTPLPGMLNAVWGLNAARTRAFAAYVDSSGFLQVAGFAINATTGELTFVSKILYGKIWEGTVSYVVPVSDTLLVVGASLRFSQTTNYRVIGFATDSSGAVLSAGGSTTTVPSNAVLRPKTSTSVLAQTFNSRFTVTPQSTSGFTAPNPVGFARTTTSTSPASIVFNGILGGFSGLQAGAKYYLSDSLDGTISANIPSLSYPTELGTAVSATELNVSLSSFNPNTITQYTLPQAQAIGAYFFRGTNGSPNGNPPPGTWRVMSDTWGGNGSVQLWLRIA